MIQKTLDLRPNLVNPLNSPAQLSTAVRAQFFTFRRMRVQSASSGCRYTHTPKCWNNHKPTATLWNPPNNQFETRIALRSQSKMNSEIKLRERETKMSNREVSGMFMKIIFHYSACDFDLCEDETSSRKTHNRALTAQRIHQVGGLNMSISEKKTFFLRFDLCACVIRFRGALDGSLRQ